MAASPATPLCGATFPPHPSTTVHLAASDVISCWWQKTTRSPFPYPMARSTRLSSSQDDASCRTSARLLSRVAMPPPSKGLKASRKGAAVSKEVRRIKKEEKEKEELQAAQGHEVSDEEMISATAAPGGLSAFHSWAFMGEDGHEWGSGPRAAQHGGAALSLTMESLLPLKEADGEAEWLLETLQEDGERCLRVPPCPCASFARIISPTCLIWCALPDNYLQLFTTMPMPTSINACTAGNAPIVTTTARCAALLSKQHVCTSLHKSLGIPKIPCTSLYKSLGIQKILAPPIKSLHLL